MIPQSVKKPRRDHAETFVAALFADHGWTVEVPAQHQDNVPKLMVQGKNLCYAIEVKAPSETRADRVLPLLSQAILKAQAQAAANEGGNARPLAVIFVARASEVLAKQVMRFAEKYAPQVAVGIVSEQGFRQFRGLGLEDLNTGPEITPRLQHRAPPRKTTNLFSDLNQWLLKVLLAPELPDGLLNAPRASYASGSGFATAAQVSKMSASRFLQQLQNEGHLDVASGYFTLVRREELFRRWSATSMRPAPELPVRFLIRSSSDAVHALVAGGHGDLCLGSFAAAEVMNLGHVSGVPPSVCIRKLPSLGIGEWRMLSDSRTEVPDMVLRQALTPESLFRGAVQCNGVLVSDVIQVWLDVANHPSRGAEQAELLYRKILAPMLMGKH